ncbi:MAG TPA: 16S rRNA processing protein RimM [Armatimonadetes bacterium]|nr:16S rRNA processing protein RimM [Armatimonadota bacterium]
MRPDSSDYVVIGEIVAPHGVRGVLRVVPWTDVPHRFEGLEQVRVRWPSGRLRVYAVEYVGRRRGQVLLKLAGCETREEAEALRGAEIVVREEERAPLPPGEYYVDDIVGLRVVTTRGEEVGVIEEVLHTGSNDVYVTARALIPALWQIIREIDLVQGRMVIDPPPGLLEE